MSYPIQFVHGRGRPICLLHGLILQKRTLPLLARIMHKNQLTPGLWGEREREDCGYSKSTAEAASRTMAFGQWSLRRTPLQMVTKTTAEDEGKRLAPKDIWIGIIHDDVVSTRRHPIGFTRGSTPV